MDLQQGARKYFNVELPVLSAVLKSAFRSASRRFHPDMGGTDEQFKEMKRVYDAIQDAGLLVQSSKDMNQAGARLLRTVDGTLLSDLGLGLGPTTNGRDCDTCSGFGYRSWTEPIRRMVQCNRCAGRGCWKCWNTGREEKTVGQSTIKYARCGTCNGTGEIKIYNPVILKGSIPQSQRKRGK